MPVTLSASQEARNYLQKVGKDPLEYVDRFVRCDWGDADEHTVESNERSLTLGKGMICGEYRLEDFVCLDLATLSERRSDVVLSIRFEAHEL